MKKLYYGLFFCLLFFVLSLPASAQETQTTQTDSTQEQSQTTDDPTDTTAYDSTAQTSATPIPQIIISEINWAGSELSQSDEWIEIYNADSTAVDISGWILTGCATSGNAIALEDGTIIEASKTLLISNYDLGYDKTTLLTQPDLVTTSISLSNSALQIMLAMPDGTVVDYAGDGGAPYTGSTTPKTSMVRDLNTLEWLSATQQINLSDTTQFGTPHALEAYGSDGTEALGDSEPQDVIEVSEETSTSDDSAQDTEVTADDQTVVEQEKCHLIINEFVSNPNTDELEWIEIYNPCDASTDLTGWTVRDATLKATEFIQMSVNPLSYIVIIDPNGQLNNDGDTIELVDSQGLVIDSITYGDDPKNPGKGYSLALNDQNIWAQTCTPTQGLVNVITDVCVEPDVISGPETTTTVAQDETVSEVIDTSDADEGVTATEEETNTESESMTQADADQEADSETQSETLTSYSWHNVILNEIVSDPAEGEVEWIELFNPSDANINLSGWTITDASGKATELDGLTINSNEYIVIESPKGKLNNDGDTITLFDSYGNEIDKLTYGTNEIQEPEKGESIALGEFGWIITNTITKGETNNLIYEEETTSEVQEQSNASADDTTTPTSGHDSQTQPQTISNSEQASSGNDSNISNEFETHHIVAIAETPKATTSNSTKTTDKSSSISQNQTMSGVITAIPGTFGSQIAFIEGTQLYFYYADWPMLEIGDIVKVSGEMSESRGENRIKISDIRDIEIIGHEDVIAQSLAIDELSKYVDGTLVQIEGSVANMQDAKLTLSDSTGSATVVANSHEGMTWETVGTKLKITGILRTVSGEQRIYPRNMHDVEIIEDTTSTNEMQEPIAVGQSTDYTPWVGGGLLVLSLASFAYYYSQRKNLETLQVGA